MLGFFSKHQQVYWTFMDKMNINGREDWYLKKLCQIELQGDDLGVWSHEGQSSYYQGEHES